MCRGSPSPCAPMITSSMTRRWTSPAWSDAVGNPLAADDRVSMCEHPPRISVDGDDAWGGASTLISSSSARTARAPTTGSVAAQGPTARQHRHPRHHGESRLPDLVHFDLTSQQRWEGSGALASQLPNRPAPGQMPRRYDDLARSETCRGD